MFQTHLDSHCQTKMDCTAMKLKYNSLIPELSVRDLKASLHFYSEVLGFDVLYERPVDKLAFIGIEQAQLMLEQCNDHWVTAPLEYPLGRGMNLQIYVTDLENLLSKLSDSNYKLMRTKCRARYKNNEGTVVQDEFLVQDPDGYLLRFAERIE